MPTDRRERRLTHAGVRFLCAFVATTVVWAVFVAPGWDRFIAESGVGLLHVVERPALTGGVRMEGARALIGHVGAAAELDEQSLELRTHHNNAPLLIALVLATPALAGVRRDRTLAIGLALLALTHVAHFVLTVHWLYAFANVGPYQVTDVRYLDRSLWQSLDNPAQVAKTLLFAGEEFYTHVGRLLAPLVIWMFLARDALGLGRATARPSRPAPDLLLAARRAPAADRIPG